MTRRENVFNALLDFDPFQNTIGYDRMFDRLNRIASDTIGQPQKYPPFNIVKQNDDTFDIELAVAGFSEDDINITVTDGIMTIEGSKTTRTEDDADKYIHKGIGTRSFTRKFSLSDTLEIKGAAMENGMLVIRLENIVPEHKKPKQIQISTGKKSIESGGKPEFLTETSEV